MAETSGPELYVHELHCTNIMKLRHVALQLQPGMNRVLGENEAGKSTFLNLIKWAIADARELPSEIITRGEERAEIVLKFGGFVVERRFHKNEKGGEEQSLVLIGPDGGRLPKPQTTLNAFYDKYCFDPVAFMRMEPKQQVEVMKRLGNLNFGPLETARAKLYEQRTEVNAKGVAAKARFIAMPTPPAELPEQPVNVDELLAEQNALQTVRLNNQAKRAELARQSERERQAEQRVQALRTAQAELEEEFERRLAQAKANVANAIAAFDKAVKEGDEMRLATGELVDPPVADLTAKISAAQTTNLWVERRDQRAKLRAELDELKKLSDDLTTQIETLDKQKTDAIAAVKFPVEKLGYSDETPLYDGLVLAQASAAIQLRVSVAIGVALNPKLRLMLVRDAALMGTAQLELLKQLALERRAQLLVEIAARDKKDLEVLIQEGDVVVVEGQVTVKGQSQLQLEGGAA